MRPLLGVPCSVCDRSITNPRTGRASGLSHPPATGRVSGVPISRAPSCACFAGDLPEQEQKLVWATQGVPDADLFNQKLEGTAWRSKPSWYIVGKNDRTVHPDLQRFVAKRMAATIYEVDSSHVPMLSNPKLVIDVIRTAANA